MRWEAFSKNQQSADRRFAGGSIVKLHELKKPVAISDEMLILVDVAAQARIQVAVFVAEVLRRHMAKDKAAALATALTGARRTHDLSISVGLARELGLPVSIELTRHDLELQARPHVARPSVVASGRRRRRPWRRARRPHPR